MLSSVPRRSIIGFTFLFFGGEKSMQQSNMAAMMENETLVSQEGREMMEVVYKELSRQPTNELTEE